MSDQQTEELTVESDLITPEYLDDQQDNIVKNQEFRDDIHVGVFYNEANELFIIIDHNPGGFDSISRVTSIFEYNYLDYTKILDKKYKTVDVDVGMNTCESEIIKIIQKTNLSDISKITVTNYSTELKYIFDVDFLYTLSTITDNIVIDINYSTMKVDNDNPISINNIEWISGELMVDRASSITCDKMVVKYMTLISYNDSYFRNTLNLIINSEIEIFNLIQHSTIKLVSIFNNKDKIKYDASKFNLYYCKIYGSEYDKSDNVAPRIKVKGFNKVYFDNIEVDNDVKYGTISFVDYVNYLYIGKIKRQISEIGTGSMFKIGNIGKVNVGESLINIVDGTDIKEQTSLFLLSGDNDTHKNILLNNISIGNNSDTIFNLFTISSPLIKKISISNLFITDNVEILNITNKDNEILKLTIVDSNISKKELLIPNNIYRTTIIDSTILSDKILFNCDKVNISNSKFETIDFIYNHNNMIGVTINDSTIKAKNLIVKNEDKDIQNKLSIKDTVLYINDKIEFINIIPFIFNGYMKLSTINVTSSDHLKISESIIEPNGNNIDFNLSCCCKVACTTNSKTAYSRMNIIIDPKEFILTRSNFDIFIPDDNETIDISINSSNSISSEIKDGKDNSVYVNINKNDNTTINNSQITLSNDNKKVIMIPNKDFDIFKSKNETDQSVYSIEYKK